MLFHLGALLRLNELAYLPKIGRISSVSGGSIVAGMLGLAWQRLDFDPSGRASNFDEEVIAPIRRLADTTIDWPAIVTGLLLTGSAGNRIAASYRKYLFGRATLQDLPDEPRFVFNATNLQSGVLWRISKPYMADYRVGRVTQPQQLDLALTVAASSAFPPFLSPVALSFAESDFTPGSGADLQRPPYTTRVLLTDGGVFDNLGLDAAWNYSTVLVSDGSGGPAKPRPNPPVNWALQINRIFAIVTPQAPLMRKRQVISAFVSGARHGTYWGARSNLAKDYALTDALPCSIKKTAPLGDLKTRLARLSEETQKALINWGYAVSDAALRKHVEVGAQAPDAFPYPEVPLS
jgi:NTE family protein